MKETGGYFEIEYGNFQPGIHEHSIKLNTARNCLEYILLSKKYHKLYLPYFTCDVILEPLKKLNIDHAFYHISEQLEITGIPVLKNNEAIVYTNYFGIKGSYIKWLSANLDNLIIDNAQALFEPALKDIDTFYSLRKFVGVPDGGFLYCNKELSTGLPTADSSNRVSHLYKRKNVNSNFGYVDFANNDKSLSGLPLSYMSASTEAFVQSYDFGKNKTIRERNFLYLHSKLHQQNKLDVDTDNLNGPLCYPYFSSANGLKEMLINSKVYVATYWPNVLNWVNDNNAVETALVNSLVCLPTDQRYDLEDMNRIIKMILQ